MVNKNIWTKCLMTMLKVLAVLCAAARYFLLDTADADDFVVRSCTCDHLAEDYTVCYIEAEKI